MTSMRSAWTTTSRHAALLALAVLLALPAAAQTVPVGTAPSRTVRVSGDAEVLVVPDEAVLRLGVETLDADLTDAVAQNTRAVEAVAEVARRAGVAELHIATDYLDVQPQRASRDRNGLSIPEVYGYRVRRSVTVTVRDLDAFDTLLRDAVAAGANTVHGVDFQTTELRRYRDQARAEAVAAAREKAEALAAGLGQSVGAPLSISERGQGGWRYGSGWGSGFGPGAIQNVSVSAGAPSAAAPGQISVRAGVDVTFALGE